MKTYLLGGGKYKIQYTIHTQVNKNVTPRAKEFSQHSPKLHLD